MLRKFCFQSLEFGPEASGFSIGICLILAFVANIFLNTDWRNVNNLKNFNHFSNFKNLCCKNLVYEVWNLVPKRWDSDFYSVFLAKTLSRKGLIFIRINFPNIRISEHPNIFKSILLSPTFVTTIQYFFPVFLPFFTPRKRKLACFANFFWKIYFFMRHF